jgi:hypothetical protein
LKDSAFLFKNSFRKILLQKTAVEFFTVKTTKSTNLALITVASRAVIERNEQSAWIERKAGQLFLKKTEYSAPKSSIFPSFK